MTLFKGLFVLRGKLDPKTRLKWEIIGLGFIILAWWAAVATGLVKPRMLPSPLTVVLSYKELFTIDKLAGNLLFSLMLNFAGYIEAIAISVPLGFLIGLFPLPRAVFERPITALRFLPLSAVIGLLILWFGIYTNMKVQFLTLGIVVYLLPVVIQRIDEVPQVYVDTVKTLGANQWQQMRYVYIPDTISRLSDDIRVLVAISWTYIIIAEVVNKSQGGIGALAYTASRQARPDKVFAILAVIMLVGFIQDKLFKLLDKWMFHHKYV
jgi:NitT/TauT family transport system permease protein